MTLTEFKKVANLLKQAYREVEAEALTAGIDLMSEEYDQLIAKTRELVITSSGFTVDDFDQLKSKINSTSKVGMYDYMEKVKVRIKNLEDNYRHSTKEIEDIARKIASEFVKPPQIINQIVKEVTIEKPQIIKETTVEKTVETIDYNDEPLKQELETLRRQITDIPRLNEHQLKEDMKGYFSETLKKNIDILGMPDFRKLAMGLQAQIDALRDNPGTGGGTFLDLTDTPSSYSGQSGKVPAVKATEDGLEFIAASGSGTVTSVSSADANLTVATGTTTPVLTIVNAPTVTIADAGGDTTTFPMLATAATGNLAPATDAGLTYNATDNALTTTTFVGALTGNASTATALATPRTIGGTSFDGTANIVPATITVADTTDATSFVALFESATGDLAPKTDAGLTYDASTGTLTATALVGPLTGNVTGNASGTAATVTSASQAAITTLANLTSVQGRTVTLADAGANAIFGWDDVAGAYENLTQAEVLAVIGDSTATAKGVVELATDAETVTGTDTARATTPANITARLAAPGAIGGTTAAAATFTTVTANTGIEVQNTDTTITRSAAGVIAVEGVVIPSISSTNTLTNKRITKRVGTTTSSATPTINTDNVDYYSLTAQAADITSFTTNLSGTPTDNQTLWISITGTAARAITWGSSFESSTVTLPTTTVSTNRLDVGFVWNSVSSKWRCVAKC